ncbi:MAG: hypothetical protein H0W72_09175, partial [Planctomycetes bacterium]|nr:hypothetical protein [Planctomycetota bacterium]
SRPLPGREPAPQLLASPALSGSDIILAARGTGHALVYSAGGRDLTIDLAQLSGSEVDTWWFDPRSGQGRHERRVPRSGQARFTPPCVVGEDPDWLLVLDDPAAGFAPPGTGQRFAR